MKLKMYAITAGLLTCISLVVIGTTSKAQSPKKQAEGGKVVFSPVDGEEEVHRIKSGTAVVRNGIKGTEYTLGDGTTFFVAADPLDDLSLTLESQNALNTEYATTLEKKLESARKNGDSAQAKILQAELEDFQAQCQLNTLVLSMGAFLDSYKTQRKEIAAMRTEIHDLKQLVASMAK